MANTLFAQNYIYSLNPYSLALNNPSYPALDNDASVSFLNQKTHIAAGIDYSHNLFAGEYPLIQKNKSGRRFGGIGVHVLEKDAGNSDLLKTYTTGLSLAYNLQVLEDQFIGFGIQSVYYNKKTSVENLTTGSQWLASEFRFDPNASLDEPFSENRINYLGINAGATWYMVDKATHHSKAFFSASAFNLNRPDDSFFQNQSRIPISYLVSGGAIVYKTRKLQILPQLFYLHENGVNQFNLLGSASYHFRNENPYDVIGSGSVELTGKYDFRRSLALGVLVNQPGFSVGFSYNFPVAGESANQYFNGGVELGIRLFKTIRKVKPTQVVIENIDIETKRNFDFGNKPSTPAPAQKSDVEVIQEKITDLSNVRSVQFKLEKDFKFPFGRTDLSDEAKLYLDDLYELMTKNPEYKLEVIGHTDNVGKPLVNYRLSAARAQSVADYLKQKGLDEERIFNTGKGDTHPVAPNDSEENKSKNRRVEFIIYVDR